MNMCEQCPEYTRPRGNTCESDECADSQVLEADGTCRTVECSSLEIRGKDGSCEKCFPYTRPQDNGTRCDSDDCPKGIV